MKMNDESLKLDNQVCFPLYAASRLVTQCYQPLLTRLDLTYPQYLVMLVLWEKDKIPLREIAERLLLQSNTLTPLLKRMQVMGLVDRERSSTDERSIVISLTGKGKGLKDQALEVPEKLGQTLPLSADEAEQLGRLLKKVIGSCRV